MMIEYKNLNVENFKHFIIFSDGRVKNTITDKFINGDVNNCGYERVQLYKNGIIFRAFRHRLVAEYFVDGYNKNLQVNHIDGNKRNNCFCNLEWVTQSENEQHKQKFLNPKRTVKRVRVVDEDDFEFIFESQKDFCEYFKCTQASASQWLLKKTNSRSYNFKILEYI